MAAPDQHTDTAGVTVVFGAAAAFGTLGVISNLAYDAGMSAAVFTALRAALGASILGALVLLHLQPGTSIRALPTREKRMFLVAIVTNGSMNLLVFAGLQAMSVALVMTVFYTYPLMVMFVQAVRGQEQVTPMRIVALIVAMAGLLLVLGSQVGPEAHVSLAGIGLGLGAAICQAAYLIVSRDGYPSVPAVQATSFVLIGGVLISGSAALLTGSLGSASTWAVESTAWLAVIVAGTLGAALPKVMLLVGVRRIGGTRTATVMLSEPVMAVVFAAIVLSQEITVAQVIGGAAILLGAALAQLPSRRDRDSATIAQSEAASASRE